MFNMRIPDELEAALEADRRRDEDRSSHRRDVLRDGLRLRAMQRDRVAAERDNNRRVLLEAGVRPEDLDDVLQRIR